VLDILLYLYIHLYRYIPQHLYIRKNIGRRAGVAYNEPIHIHTASGAAGVPVGLGVVGSSVGKGMGLGEFGAGFGPGVGLAVGAAARNTKEHATQARSDNIGNTQYPIL
jgi:hypothetical protein